MEREWDRAEKTRSGVRCGDLWFSGEHYMIHGPHGLYIVVPIAGQHNYARNLADDLISAMNTAKVSARKVEE